MCVYLLQWLVGVWRIYRKDGITMCSRVLFFVDGFVVIFNSSVIEDVGLIYVMCDEPLWVSRFIITYRVWYTYYTFWP
jgi:hypothetical protein